MLEVAIFWLFVGAILTLFVGIGLLIYIRKRIHLRQNEFMPAGFWVRITCFATDLAIIDILKSFLAYRGSLQSAGYITILLTVSYFFFFWMLFSATPAMMLARIKIYSKDSEALNIWQVLVRLGMFAFLLVGWVTMLFDKKEKRALHDLVSRTFVVYSDQVPKKDSELVKRLKYILLGMIVVLLGGLIVSGSGEKLTKYTANDQIIFFDMNKDGLTDGMTFDVDGNGKFEVVKYDLNHDQIVDFSAFDVDKDGTTESIDVNNDGRIDGFDFDGDTVLDIHVQKGQFYIWLRRVFVGIWIAGFTALLVLAMVKERKHKAHE
ncbi:MAG: RDD family protein [Patescibacteria group bacterium]